MNSLVLSGTRALVLSGTGSSCYRGPESTICCHGSKACSRPNLPNIDSFGIFLTRRRFRAAADNFHPLKKSNKSGEGPPRVFGVGGLACDAEHVAIINGSRGAANLMCSALLASDLALIPVQSSWLDRLASTEKLALVVQALTDRPELAALFVLHHCCAGAPHHRRDTRAAWPDYDHCIPTRNQCRGMLHDLLACEFSTSKGDDK